MRSQLSPDAEAIQREWHTSVLTTGAGLVSRPARDRMRTGGRPMLGSVAVGRRLVLPMLALLVVVAGCGSGDQGSDKAGSSGGTLRVALETDLREADNLQARITTD